MRMLADAQLCGGYVRYLPVTKLDGETKKLAIERFMEFRRNGVIKESGFRDDIWLVTNELRKYKIDFHIDREAYDKNSLQWIGCTSDCYKECVKAYALKVDLDEEYRKDNGQAVIAKLSYNARDAKANLPVPQEFNFKEGCNVVQRLTDLRSSVNRYFDFCKNG